METKRRHLDTYSLILCAVFSALVGIGAFIRISIPVLPFTLQFLFSTLAGLLLGSKLGAISVLVYILVGLVGFLVFTTGGGIGYIFQPTFGYIIGFCVGAYVTGLIVEKSECLSIKTLLLATFSGLVIVYTFGMVYYYLIAKYYVGSPIGIKALFSIVTSGRKLSDEEVDKLCKCYQEIKQRGKISICASHGLLTKEQFKKLKSAGVSRYHNNL